MAKIDSKTIDLFTQAVTNHVEGMKGENHDYVIATESWGKNDENGNKLASFITSNEATVQRFLGNNNLLAGDEDTSFGLESHSNVVTSTGKNWIAERARECGEKLGAFSLMGLSLADPKALIEKTALAMESFNKWDSVDYIADYSKGRFAHDAIRGKDVVQLATEAFAQQPLSTSMNYSVAYNILAATQDPVLSACYLEIAMSQDQVVFFTEISVDRYLWDTKRTSVTRASGRYFDKGLLPNVIRYPDRLEDQSLALVPFFDETPGAGNTQWFMPKTVREPKIEKVNNVSIPTQPLLVDTEYDDFMALCSHPELMKGNHADQTDTIDGAVGLKSIFISMKSDDDAQGVVEFPLLGLQSQNFTKSRQGHSEDMILNFATTEIVLHKGLRDVKGNEVALLKALGDKEIRLSVSLTGELNLESAYLVVRQGVCRPIEVIDATTGEVINCKENPSAVSSVISPFDFKVKYFNPEAYRSNINQRMQGMLIDTDSYTALFAIPAKSPIRARRPVDGSKDTPSVESLVRATRLKKTADGFRVMREYLKMLKEYCSAQHRIGTNRIPDFIGLGKWFVRPYYKEIDFDAAEVVKSLESGRTLENLRGALCNVLQEAAADCMVKSQYMVGMLIKDGEVSKPHFSINTGQYLPLLLHRDGDLRLLGQGFESTIAVTPNHEFDEKILMVPTRPNVKEYDALTWGNTFQYAEQVIHVPNYQFNGTMVKVDQVTPRYQHVNNCPIAIVVNVKNCRKVLNEYGLFKLHDTVAAAALAKPGGVGGP